MAIPSALSVSLDILKRLSHGWRESILRFSDRAVDVGEGVRLGAGACTDQACLKRGGRAVGSSNGVAFVRWPAQSELRNQARRDGIPRLLVVEGNAAPPVCLDPIEDWVRAPISRADLDARVRALKTRLDSSRVPTLDPAGTLYFGSESITMSSTQTELMELLVGQFGQVVYRSELTQRLAERVQEPTRNLLDLQIMRLRRRLIPLDLAIRTVWGRGYMLDFAAD